MSNQNIVPFQGGQVPAALKQFANDGDDLTAGVNGGFAVVSFRGSKWRIKYQGEESPVLNADGDPVSTLEVVLLKANKHISKNYYEQGYTEGAADSPTCFSLDGINPDPSVQQPIAASCAKCPKNVFGSRITDNGKKAKACADNRRVAVAPLWDLRNESFGGPMLLRVPVASLPDLKMFGETLKKRGYPYNAVAVRLGFDLDVAYPKLTFRAIRPLTDDEAAIVLEHLQGDKIERVLSTAVEIPAAEGEEAQPPVDDVFEQPPQQPAAKPAAKPVATKPVTAKPAAAKPAAATKPAAAQANKPAAVPGRGTVTAAKASGQAAKPAQTVPPEPEGEETIDPSVGADLDRDIEGILAGLDNLT